jgi:hypothetical protein
MKPSGVCSPMNSRRFSVGNPAGCRADVDQRVNVVHVLEPADRDDRRRFALPQQVVDVAGPQRRVGGHENRADLRERELKDDPFRHIGGPDHHALAGLDADGAQPARDRACFMVELGECVARTTGVDECIARWQRARESREQIADGHVVVRRLVHDGAIVYWSS